MKYWCHDVGLIQAGDELRQVNGVAVTGKQPDDVIQLIVRKTSCLLFILPRDAVHSADYSSNFFHRRVADG